MMDAYREDGHHDDDDGDSFTADLASHTPLSPATGAESLFLAGLTTSHISANALANQLHSSSDRSSVYSMPTDDFVSAVGNTDDLQILHSCYSSDDETYNTKSIPELDSDSDAETTNDRDINMVKKNPTSTVPASTAVTTPAPVSEKHIDPASHVYEGAKGVWAWGKGLPVVSLGFGVTEAVAGKVAEVAGTNLKDIDEIIKPKLTDLDSGLLNPAIEKVVTVVLGAAGKTEDIIKPIIVKVLSPFGLIEAEK